MDQSSEISLIDVRKWKESPVTKEFFKKIGLKIKDNSNQIAISVRNDKLNDAIRFEAAKSELMFVSELIEMIRDEIKEREGVAE